MLVAHVAAPRLEPHRSAQRADRCQDMRGIGPLGAMAFTHPRALQAARKVSRNRGPTSCVSKRQRKSCNHVKSKLGSVKSRLRAYLQSIPCSGGRHQLPKRTKFGAQVDRQVAFGKSHIHRGCRGVWNWGAVADGGPCFTSLSWTILSSGSSLAVVWYSPSPLPGNTLHGAGRSLPIQQKRPPRRRPLTSRIEIRYVPRYSQK
jgi:hypothetical protein